MNHRIVIVGGGFGGVAAALRLARARLPHTSITLISDKPWLEYYGVLYRLLAGRRASEACIPLALICKGLSVEIIHERIARIDAAHNTVIGASRKTYSFDTLIVAPGSEPHYFDIPGMEEHAYSMQHAGQALELRQRVEDCVARMKSASATEQEKLGRFVVIGAGPTGVEIASEVAILGRSLARSANIDPSHIHVDLIDVMDRVLPFTEPRVSARVMKRLQQLHIDVHLQHAVTEAQEHSVRFKNGTVFDASTLIWTVGVKAHSLIGTLGTETDKRGRAIVDEQLRAKGHEHIFVGGDCASTPYAGMAQTAVEDGTFIASVIIAQRTGAALPTYEPRKPAYAIPIGIGWAAVKFGPLTVFGALGYFMRRAADLHVYSLILPWYLVPVAFVGALNLAAYNIRPSDIRPS